MTEARATFAGGCFWGVEAAFRRLPQRAAAEASRDAVARKLSKPVLTRVEDAPVFWPAEEYHQRSLERHSLARWRTSPRR